MSKHILNKLLLIALLLFTINTLMLANDIGATQEYQSSFINKLTPIITQENENISQERRFVEDFFKRYNKEDTSIDAKSFNALLETAKRYKIADIFDKSEYLLKIDAIPVTLALSQAALESGWGQSKVAQKSQNYFGQRKFTEAVDLEQLNYAKFRGIEEGVKAYMLNLNAHEAYKEFREKRALYAQDGKKINGKIAAKTLKKYSNDGSAYVKMLSEIINQHFVALDNIKNRPQNVRTIL
jgi:Bax protein